MKDMPAIYQEVEQREFEEIAPEDFWQRYYASGRPVLLRNGVSAWPAMAKWGAPYFRSVAGSAQVKLRSHPSGIFDYNAKSALGIPTTVQTSFAQAMQKILCDQASIHYVQQQSMEQGFPQLLQDIDFQLLDTLPAKRVVTNLWVGSQGCKSPLHFDQSENFLAQVAGTKQVTLFAPAQSEYLYPAIGDNLPHCSRVDVFDPDLATFPLFARAMASGYSARLAKGDILYIPMRWWHAVESLSFSISVNIWWLPRSRSRA